MDRRPSGSLVLEPQCAAAPAQEGNTGPRRASAHGLGPGVGMTRVVSVIPGAGGPAGDGGRPLAAGAPWRPLDQEARICKVRRPAHAGKRPGPGGDGRELRRPSAALAETEPGKGSRERGQPCGWKPAAGPLHSLPSCFSIPEAASGSFAEALGGPLSAVPTRPPTPVLGRAAPRPALPTPFLASI